MTRFRARLRRTSRSSGPVLPVFRRLHLAKAGKAVTVLEAEDVGYGASGRNNGQVIPVLTRADPDALCARFGDAGERFVKLIGGSAAYLFDLVRENGLNCEAEQNGWIQPAHTPGRFRAISENRFRQWEKHGAEVELIDKAELDRRIGTNFFFGGFGNRTGGHINPLALTRELARAPPTTTRSSMRNRRPSAIGRKATAGA